MPGFPLAAIGAGLGQWAQQAQQQQAQRERNQMLMMTLQRFQQEMQDRQQERASAEGLWGSIGGGGSGIKPVDPMGGGGGVGVPLRAPLPAAASAPDFGAAGEYGGGQGPPAASGVDPFTTRLMALGVLPEVAGGVVDYMRRNESNLDPGATNPKSGALGVAQWLGPRKAMLTSQYGERPSADQQAAFMGGELQGSEAATLSKLRGAKTADEGYRIWGQSYERPSPAELSVALSRGPSGGTRPIQVADAGGLAPGFARGPEGGLTRNGHPPDTYIGGLRGPGGGATPAWREDQQVADAGPAPAAPAAPAPPLAIPDLRKRLNAIIPPDVNGRMSEAALKAKIDQACPSCPAVYKLKYLDSELRRLAPMEAERVRAEHDRYKTQIDAETKMWEEENRARREADKGEVKEFGGVPYRVKGTTATPITTGAGAPLSGKEQIGKPQLLEYTKEDGTVERVEAQQLQSGAQKGQWVTADQLRAPIDVSKGKWSIVPASQASAMGGTRDAAQRERQLIAGREVISDLQNVVQLPITTTRGIFGGRTQGPGLMDAIKENLAEKMTDEDAQLANSALAGLERELSIIVSPVYGGKWAAESFGALKLKEGQTVNTKLYNLARMRQTADNALEAMVTSPRIGEEQKRYAKSMREMLDKAVAWTPADVIAYRQKGKTETFGEFVMNKGIGGGAERKAGEAGGPGPSAPDMAKGTQDILDQINNGKLTPEAGKKLLIEKFGYTPAQQAQ